MKKTKGQIRNWINSNENGKLIVCKGFITSGISEPNTCRT